MKYYVERINAMDSYSIMNSKNDEELIANYSDLDYCLIDATKVVVLDSSTADSVRRKVKRDTRIVELCSVLPYYDSKTEYHLNIPFNELKALLGLPNKITTIKAMDIAINNNLVNIDYRVDKQIASILQAHYKKLDSYGDFQTQLKTAVAVDVNASITKLADCTFLGMLSKQEGKLYSMLKDIVPDESNVKRLLVEMCDRGTSLENVRQVAMLYSGEFKQYFKIPETESNDLNKELHAILKSNYLSPYDLHFGSMYPNTADTLQMSYNDLSKILTAIDKYHNPKQLLKYLAQNTITLDNGIAAKIPEYSKSRNFSSMKLYTVHRKSITMIITLLVNIGLDADAIMRSSEK